MALHHPPSPAPARFAALGHPFLQLGDQHLPLVRPQIFLDLEEMMPLLFLQLALEIADLFNLNLHRRPVRQVTLLEEGDQGLPFLGQFVLELPDLAPVFRRHGL